MLTTLLLPSSGSASVLGLDVVHDARSLRSRIGCVFGGDRGLYDRLSALDNLRYFAELYAVPPDKIGARLDHVIELVGLRGRERDRVEHYSRGMRQRLHIARGLLHDPEVVFLDEPTIGVDPVGAAEIRKTIKGLATAGRTILLTTHYMFEADSLCDRLGIIDRGRMVAEGSSDELKASVQDGEVIEVELRGLDPAGIDGLRRISGVAAVTVEERGDLQLLRVQGPPGTDLTPAVLAGLEGVRITRVQSRKPTLEDAYLALVTRE